jgi:hypothetical protein
VELVEAENSCELSRTGVARLVMSTDALAATLVRVREGAKMAGRRHFRHHVPPVLPFLHQTH